MGAAGGHISQAAPAQTATVAPTELKVEWKPVQKRVGLAHLH